MPFLGSKEVFQPTYKIYYDYFETEALTNQTLTADETEAEFI